MRRVVVVSLRIEGWRMTDAQAPAATRMDLPPARGAVLLVVFVVFVLFSVGVAGGNLWSSAGHHSFVIGASVVWLCIVVFVLGALIAEAGGVRRWLVRLLGVFSRRVFLEICRAGDGGAALRYGFELSGRAFDYSRIELAWVRSVSWGSGQVSWRSGRDRDDWSVAVWYRRVGDSGGLNRAQPEPVDLIVVTPYLPKDLAAAVGGEVVGLLSDAGVLFEPGDGEHEFVVVGDDAADQ